MGFGQFPFFQVVELGGLPILIVILFQYTFIWQIMACTCSCDLEEESYILLVCLRSSPTGMAMKRQEENDWCPATIPGQKITELFCIGTFSKSHHGTNQTADFLESLGFSRRLMRP